MAGASQPGQLCQMTGRYRLLQIFSRSRDRLGVHTTHGGLHPMGKPDKICTFYFTVYLTGGGSFCLKLLTRYLYFAGGMAGAAGGRLDNPTGRPPEDSRHIRKKNRLFPRTAFCVMYSFNYFLVFSSKTLRFRVH